MSDHAMSARVKVLSFMLGTAAVIMLMAAAPRWIARVQLSSREIAFDERTMFERVDKGDVQAVILLLKGGIDPDAMDAGRTTGLMHAAKRGDVAMAKAFIEGGADLDYRGPFHIGIPFLSSEPPKPDSVPLVIAAREGRAEVVRLLLEHGAHHNRHDASVAMFAAVQGGHVAVIERLRAAGVTKETRVRRGPGGAGALVLLHQAVSEGRADVVRALLPGSRELDLPGPDGFRALAIAVRKNHRTIVLDLLAAGASLKALSREELAASVVTARSGRADALEALVESYAGAGLSGRKEYDTLRAASFDRAPPTRTLLEALDLPAEEARDLALLSAAARGDAVEVRTLLGAGANPSLRDWDGATALDHAALAGHLDVVEALVDAGAPTSSVTGRHHLIDGGPAGRNHEAIRELLRSGRPLRRPPPDSDLARIVNRPVDGRGGRATTLRAAQDRASVDPVSALIDAAGSVDPRSAAEILRRGTAIDGTDDRGVTALTHAVDMRNADTARFLIASRADVNARGASYAMTALMFATMHGRPDLVELLVAAGADVNAEDSRGLTALQYARDWKRLHDRIGDRLRYAAMISWLLAHGARDR